MSKLEELIDELKGEVWYVMDGYYACQDFDDSMAQLIEAIVKEAKKEVLNELNKL